MATISKDKLTITVELDGSENVEKSLKAIQGALDKAGKDADKAGSGFSKFQATLVTLNQGLNLAKSALAGAQRAFQAFDGAITDAGKIDALNRSFETLQQSVGLDATDSLNKLRDATQGLITDIDLVTASNKAVQLGLPTEGFDKAAAAAIKLGRSMGVDATNALNDFTTGVGRASPLILDNLGIIVKAGEANKEYAETYKIVGRELNETEKKLAFQAKAYKSVLEASENAADINLNTADSYQQLKTSVSNLTNEFISSLTENEALGDAFNDLRDAIEEVDVDAMVSAFNGLVTFITNVVIPTFEGLVLGIGALGHQFTELKRLADRDFLGKSTVSSINLAKSLEGVGVGLKSVSTGLKNIKSTGDLIKLKSELAALQVAINSSDKGSELYGDTLLKLQKRVLELNVTTLKKTKTDEEVLVLTKEQQKAAKDYASQIAELDDVINRTTEGALSDFREGLFRLGIDGVESLEENSKAVKDYAIEFAKLNDIDLGKLTKEIENHLSDQEKAFEDAAKEHQKYLDDIARQQEQFYAELEQIGANAIGGILDGIGDGANSEDYKQLATDIGGQLGSAFGAAYGPAGAALGKFLGEKAIGGLFNTAQAVKDGSTQDIRKALEDMNLFGEAGVDIATFGLLGGKNAAANARESVKDLFNEVIEETNFQIERFRLPNGRNAFNPFINEQGDWTTSVGQELEGVNQEILSFYSGISGGLEEFFEIEDLESGQLGQLLAANFGVGINSANDLQIILQSMGLDAEQLGEAVEAAWLKGDIGAGEFLNTLNQTEELFKVGIPNALGATGQAYDNLANGGLNTGAEALDAIIDLGAEFNELLESTGSIAGATFDDLRENLIAQNKPLEDVDRLFQAFAANGITSLEGLTGATARQAAGVIDSLEGLGFGFTAASDDIKQLAQDVEAIKSKEIDIGVNIRTNIDSNTRDYQDVITGGYSALGGV